jgi:ferritin-like metal-binding protein YciE
MTDTQGKHKLARYLAEARATELALTRTLQAHIAMTPAGDYRRLLERHLRETREHAKRVERRARDLGFGRSLAEQGLSVVQGLFGQVLSLSKGPIDLLRGRSGAEKLLKNARDESATEALEIATYDAIEELARALGDEQTATLAASIRADEERVLEELRDIIPSLVADVVRSELQGVSTYDPSTTGAAREARKTERAAKGTARRAASEARRAGRELRKVPGVARAEGEVKGAVASEDDLPIPGYDKLNAEEIVKRLPELSQLDLAKIDAYERRHQARKSVLERIEQLHGDEPWPGYDELNVEEIRKRLASADESVIAKVRDYERRHKGRQGVLEAVEKATARA